jgi:hypothetical protein
MAIILSRDGWTLTTVGCHWYRGPYTIASIQDGQQFGYVLTFNRHELIRFASWDEAVEAARLHEAGLREIAENPDPRD